LGARQVEKQVDMIVRREENQKAKVVKARVAKATAGGSDLRPSRNHRTVAARSRMTD